MMKNAIHKTLVLSVFTAVICFSGVANAEEKQSHKHHKATMPGATHQAHVEGQSKVKTKEKPPVDASKKHVMRNGVHMQGKSHREHMSKKIADDAEASKHTEKSHKHYKATMKGEKHNE